MPRKSPFDINLASEERQSLESMERKYTSPYCDVIRAKIILLADQGLANDVIAARLDTPRPIVSKWRKQFALARLAGLEARPRGGRKARFSPSLVVPVKALTGELFHNLGLPLSRRSTEEIRQHVMAPGLVAEISGATLGRWLSSDALRPNIEAGSFLAIRILQIKPAPSSIFTHASGTVPHWAPMIMSSPQTKRPAFRLVAGSS